MGGCVGEMETFLEKTYFDVAHVAGYAGVKKLVHAAREAGFHDASYGRVKKWLSKQETYALTKPVRRKLPRGSVIVGGLNHQFEADLIDWSKFGDSNDGYRYAVVVEDIFSRYCMTAPVKTKTTAEVSSVLKKMFTERRKPKYLILTDAGMELIGKKAKALYKSFGIVHLVARNEVKAGHVERLIKTLRSKINKVLLEKQSHRWLDYLQPVTNAYNRTKHSATGFAPRDVTEANEPLVRIRQWEIKHKKRTQIKREVKPKVSRSRPRKPKYKPGQLVRISRLKEAFTREYSLKWSGELFKIRRVYMRDPKTPIYLLDDFAGDPIVGTFYEQEITPAAEPEIYKIEKILKTRKRGKKKEVLVKWWLWDSKFNSYIDASAVKNIQGK